MKETTTMAKPTKKIDKERYYKALNDLYYIVSTGFDKCEDTIFDAQDAVGYSNLKRATKTKLLKMFQGIWSNMQEIVDTIGRCGKVK